MKSEHRNQKKEQKKSMSDRFAQCFSTRMAGPPSPPPLPLISNPQPFDQRRLRPGDMMTLSEKKAKDQEKRGRDFINAYRAAKVAAEASLAQSPTSSPKPRHHPSHRSSTERKQAGKEPIRPPPPTTNLQSTPKEIHRRPVPARAATSQAAHGSVSTTLTQGEVLGRPIPAPAANTNSVQGLIRRRPVHPPSSTPIALGVSSGESKGERKQEERPQTRWADFVSSAPKVPVSAVPSHQIKTVPRYNAQMVHPAHHASVHVAPSHLIHPAYRAEVTARSSHCNPPNSSQHNTHESTRSSGVSALTTYPDRNSEVSALSGGYETPPSSPTSIYSRTTTFNPLLSRTSSPPPLPPRQPRGGFYDPNLANLRAGPQKSAIPAPLKLQSSIGRGQGKGKGRESDAGWEESYQLYRDSDDNCDHAPHRVPKYDGVGSGAMGINNQRDSFYNFYSDLLRSPSTSAGSTGKANTKR